jgi:hypothetical protein
MMEAIMAHEEQGNMSKNSDNYSESPSNEVLTAKEQLVAAQNKIEELTLQIAWLERTYE